MLTRKMTVLLLSLALAFTFTGCQSQKPATQGDQAKPAFPDTSKTIEIVVHSSAGTGTDVFARNIMKSLKDDSITKNNVIVNNVQGGGGASARKYVVDKNTGNAYMLQIIQPTAISRPLQNADDVPYTNFTTIANLANETLVVVVKADSKYKVMQDLVNESKNRRVKQGGGTVGSAESMAAYLIQEKTGGKFDYVSFQTGGESVTAILGGHVDFILANPSEVISNVQGGKLRLLATVSGKRLPMLPDVPTLKEMGVEVEWNSFRGVVGPPNMPPEAVAYYRECLKKVMQSNAFKEYLKNDMVAEMYLEGKEFEDFLSKENETTRHILSGMNLLKGEKKS